MFKKAKKKLFLTTTKAKIPDFWDGSGILKAKPGRYVIFTSSFTRIPVIS